MKNSGFAFSKPSFFFLKKKEAFENTKFYAVFNSLICSDREKGKANYRFPSIV